MYCVVTRQKYNNNTTRIKLENTRSPLCNAWKRFEIIYFVQQREGKCKYLSFLNIQKFEGKYFKTLSVSRAHCVKIAKNSLLIALLLALTLLYFVIAQLSQDKSFGNKVSRVLQIITEKSGEGEEHLGNIEENPVVEREEQEPDVRADTKSEDWEEVDDPKHQIMDAKVMKKGQQKLIIVDIPNPKERWVKPEHESND